MGKSSKSDLVENQELSEIPSGIVSKYFWFFVLCGMMAIDFADRSVMSIVLPSIQRDFQINDTLAGMLGSVFGLSLALLVIPITLWAEGRDRSKTCALLVVIWSLATFSTGLATSYPFLIFSRICVAAGEAAYVPIAYSMICDQYPERRRGFLLGLFQSAGVIGTIFGNIAVGYATAIYGWRSSFVGLSVLGLFFAFVGWFMPSSSRGLTENETNSYKQKFVSGLGYLYRLPGFSNFYLILGMATMMSSSIMLWTPTLLVRRMALSIENASIIAGVCNLSAVIFGPLLGLAGDYLKRKYSFGRLWVAFFCALLHPLFVWLSLLSASQTENLFLFSLIWSLGVGALAGIFSNVVAHMQESVSIEYRVVALSLIPIGNQLLGGMVGPMLIGAVSSRYGLAFSLASVATFAMTFILMLLCIARRRIRKVFGSLENGLGPSYVAVDDDLVEKGDDYGLSCNGHAKENV